MTNREFIDENFARWMEPAMLKQEPERLEVFRAASVAAADDLDGHVLSAVLAAHRALNEESRGWVGRHLRDQDQSFVSDGKDDLLQRLAAIAVARRLSAAVDSAAILAALAVMSARFSGRAPIIDELAEITARRLDEMGSDVRARGNGEVPSFAGAIGTLPRARKPNEETGEAVDVNELASDVAVHARAIKALAAALDSTIKAAGDRQRALDEEVEMLWWVISERDEKGQPWAGRPRLERAVAAAGELAVRTEVLPGPPSAHDLLDRLLGHEGKEEVTLAELAGEVVRQGLQLMVKSGHPLLPIASAAAFYREFRSEDDDETWQKVVANKLEIQPNDSSDTSSGAVQLYRELQMVQLLPG